MLFNSLEFMVFFPVVTALYFVLPHRCRWALLLTASCVFYMAFVPVYILILAATTVIDYYAALWIEASTGKRKKRFLIVSIVSTCSFLFVFKYFNFVNGNLAELARRLDWNYPIESLAIILPIGLSFHTFQSLSYVIEVYWGRQKAERHLGLYALYVMFYPQLVAGPIERPSNLLPQFREVHRFDYQQVTGGLKRMAWGLFKKVVIADRLALAVHRVYENPTEFEGPALILATVFFAFQIYCDFSGYSDIAIGAAKVMGFDLMENFNRPYFAKSVGEFWKRWHISLSTWFRDYVYIPLGGNRVSSGRHYRNLFIAFVISGLWHGANWTFVLWGAINGMYLIISQATQGLQAKAAAWIGFVRYPRLRQAAQIARTFTLICIAWIFFRAETLSDAWYILTHLGTGLTQCLRVGYLTETLAAMGLGPQGFIVAVLVIALLEGVHLLERRGTLWQRLSEKPLWVRWSVYYAMLLGIVFLGVFGKTAFIYFQF